MKVRNITSFGIISLIIFIFILGIIIYLIAKQTTENYSQYNPTIQTLKTEILKCFPELTNLQIYEGDKSYTVNKEKIYLCIKDKNRKTYDKNILMYVLLHEIAHTLCNEVGHTQQFKDIFNVLLKRAELCNIYTPVEIPKDYCDFT